MLLNIIIAIGILLLLCGFGTLIYTFIKFKIKVLLILGILLGLLTIAATYYGLVLATVVNTAMNVM